MLIIKNFESGTVFDIPTPFGNNRMQVVNVEFNNGLVYYLPQKFAQEYNTYNDINKKSTCKAVASIETLNSWNVKIKK